MENQHRKITGYRELTAPEIALMNEIKAKGLELAALVEKVKFHLADVGQNPPEGTEAFIKATPERFVALANTEFQTGLMYLTRAVARPTSY